MVPPGVVNIHHDTRTPAPSEPEMIQVSSMEDNLRAGGGHNTNNDLQYGGHNTDNLMNGGQFYTESMIRNRDDFSSQVIVLQLNFWHFFDNHNTFFPL